MNALDPSVHELMDGMGRRARQAANRLAFAATDAKNLALTAAADAVLAEVRPSSPPTSPTSRSERTWYLARLSSTG